MRHPSRIRTFAIALGLILASFAARGAEPLRIAVEPASIRLEGGRSRQQVAVTAIGSDGSTRDVTATARYTIEGASARVSPSGVVGPVADGHASLKIESEGQVATLPIEVVRAGVTPAPSFRLDVAPILSKTGCNMGACHGNLNGKGGFKLSLRGEDANFDHAWLTRESGGRRVSVARPESSLILLKPTGAVAHEGGLRILPGSIEAHSIAGWVAAGAKDDRDTAPRLTRLSVWPTDRYLAPGPKGTAASQQLLVTAEFSDGSRRDVTRQSAFDLNDPGRASVSLDGLVTSTGPGEVAVSVRYLGGRGVSRLAFLADRPDPGWTEATPSNAIDQAVAAKLQALRMKPSEPVGDSVFLRRAYLDAIGTLPSADEARAFLADTDSEKRSKLADRLVERPEFSDFWALKWADLLRNEEKTMGSKGVWTLQRWLRDAIAADMPMDRFARQILTARGSTWQNPPASFYRTNRDPQTAAESFGQVFLGYRLQCARCHSHPYDSWTQDDYYGLAGFFSNVRRREVDNVRKDDLDKHEINGDEIVYLSGPPGTIQPRSGQKLPPKPPGGPVPDLKGDPDALDDLADWLTRDNPQFARNIANRVWFHLLGRGVVEPVDDFRESNPPSNPALLEALVREFQSGGMRLRPLVASILKTRTYQTSSRPNETNRDDEANFARASVRLLPAEVLLDAIARSLEKPNSFPGTPWATSAVQLPGVRMGGDFLRSFGKPERLLTCECERSEATTLAQAFQLINGESVRKALTASGNRIGRLIEAKAADGAILEDLYFAALSRPPAEDERQVHLSYVARSDDRRRAWEDVAWAVINSKEFLLRR